MPWSSIWPSMTFVSNHQKSFKQSRRYSMGFKYLDHALGYKHVKDQVVVVLIGRQRFLKKTIEKGDPQPQHKSTMVPIDGDLVTWGQCWKVSTHVKDSNESKECISCWRSRWHWVGGKNGTFNFFYHIIFFVFVILCIAGNWFNNLMYGLDVV